MKKIKLCAAIVAASTTLAPLSASAANDRIDFYDADGNFVSVMTDDIKAMSVANSAQNSGGGYDRLIITTVDGTRQYRIADFGQINYIQSDYTTPFEIAHTDAPNSRWVLYNALNNPPYNDPTGPGVIDPTKPYDWRGAENGYMVLFDTRPQKGFKDSYTIVGQYTGTDYTRRSGFVFFSEADDNSLGVSAYGYIMPFEPVTMTLESEELTTYAGMPFVGHYTGYPLRTPGSGLIVRNPSASFDIDIDANTSFTLKSSAVAGIDDTAFDFVDLYTYNPENNTFAYVPYAGVSQNEIDVEVKNGASGQFIGDDFVIVTLIDILNDKPENTRRYFASRKPFTFTLAAADPYDNAMLLQAVSLTPGAKPLFFYLENRGVRFTPVDLTFESGDNIAGPCSAFVRNTDSGETICRYTVAAADAAPQFTFRGAEAGSYTAADGRTLILDGFGSLTLDGREGTYTIEGGVVSATVGGQASLLVIDRDARTFGEMTSDPWDGFETYINEAAVGSFKGGDRNSLNTIKIDFDKNLMGAPAPGQASVTINIVRDDGLGNGILAAAATIGKYVYQADKGEVVITNLYLGTSPTSSTRRNLRLHISADKRSMWIDDTDDDVIYSTDRSGSYIATGEQNTLTTTAPAAGELAGSYTGEHKGILYGSAKAGESKLTIDTEAHKASISFVLMGETMLDSTVDYDFDGTVLTLRDVTVGIPGSFYLQTTKADLTFTLESDGTLSSAESEVGCVSAMMPSAVIDFSSARFIPTAK